MKDIITGLISVIIPVHNRSGMLREAVASVQEQDYPSLEIIIVDDGSSDDTPGVMSELRDRDPRIAIRSRPQAGPGAARETGRLIAAGEFIQYLDSDDLLLEGKLSRQVERLRQNPRADLCMS
ncbi:MAG: glycosyltransferase family 2 protein, partial [Acidobacteria bacterium]|nr:glycosyltransferase family 2 protein [Acidobacteriota bacterium]